MSNSPEQLDELIRRVHMHEDVSNWANQPQDHSSINLVSALTHIPKAEIDQPNLLRVRNKILDRISLPTHQSQGMFAAGWMQYLPRVMRVTGGLVGVFVIMLGLTIGTAAAALESLPGQTIYPLKKMVESVQMQLASTEQEKATLQIKFANNRVDELATIIKKKKEGKATDEQVRKAVENTVKNLSDTNLAAANQSEPVSKAELYSKIASLSDKQTAVIMTAQEAAPEEIKAELAKAWEQARISKEQAIENIERAGLSVEKTLLLTSDSDRLENNEVVAEGEITLVNRVQISIGTSHFLLTPDTEYAKINPVDLKVGTKVIIHGAVKDKKTYAVKIEPVETLKPNPTLTPTPSTAPAQPSPTPTPEANPDKTVPLNP